MTNRNGIETGKKQGIERRREIVSFIGWFAQENGYPPTVREIGKAVGLTSPSTVHAHLAQLERAGVIWRDPTKPRALRITEREAA